MADHLRPQFFLARDNGTIAPLIPVDELPHHIRIEGISRNILINETEGMTCVGTIPARHQQYKVINLNDTPAPSIDTLPESFSACSSVTESDSVVDQDHSILAPSEVSKNFTLSITPISEKGSSTQFGPTAGEVFPGPKKAYGIQEQKPNLDGEAQNISSYTMAKCSKPKTFPGSGEALRAKAYGRTEPLPAWKDTTALGFRLPPPGKKVYCSHWMSTGECDYAQQGCMYRHEMPIDIELLNYLGYQDIPKWYRERHGIGRLTAVPGSSAHVTGSSTKNAHLYSNWRADVGVNKARRAPTSVSVARSTSFGLRSPSNNGTTNLVCRTTTNPFPKAKTHESKFMDTSLLHEDVKGKNTSKDEQPRTLSLLNSRYAPIQPGQSTFTFISTSSASPDVQDLVTPTNLNSLQSPTLRNTLLVKEPPEQRNSIGRGASATRSRLNEQKTLTVDPHSFKRFSTDARRGSIASQITTFTDFESEAFAADAARKTQEAEQLQRMRAKMQAEEIENREQVRLKTHVFNADLTKKQASSAEEDRVGVQANRRDFLPVEAASATSCVLNKGARKHRDSKEARRKKSGRVEKAAVKSGGY
ncbi:hypothetical protein H2198_005279 [Neophaeococcomyces mojaviensis]|uniref:Uncharacterized protein n=1 Tax=Neophaeococcomyces mojaviensis TaxID=3383035 RepID=A0ACC3A6T7_9EURO|nr:hypothetical protein H2198_005279 [Knufia sp. JES_112]